MTPAVGPEPTGDDVEVNAAGPDRIHEIGVPDATTNDALATFRQGDVLPDFKELPILGPAGAPEMLVCPNGVVLISQTCDVVLGNRHSVQVAPLVFLDAHLADGARGGDRPRFVHVPELGETAFADLEVVATVSKRWLGRHVRTAGVARDEDVRDLGRKIGRRYSRFAFPDELHPWLEPLTKAVVSKSHNPRSHEGHVVNSDVVEFRVEATTGWASGAPYDLVLVVIVHPGVLPSFPDDEMPDLPEELNEWLYSDDGNLVRTPGEIASKLANTTDAVDRYFLWPALAEAWVGRCVPDGRHPRMVREALSSLNAEVVSADEYSLARYRRSEQLDLDHLSQPLPD